MRKSTAYTELTGWMTCWKTNCTGLSAYAATTGSAPSVRVLKHLRLKGQFRSRKHSTETCWWNGEEGKREVRRVFWEASQQIAYLGLRAADGVADGRWGQEWRHTRLV